MSLDYNFRKQDISFQTWLEKINEIVVPLMPGVAKEGVFGEYMLSNMVRLMNEEEEPFSAKLLVEGSIRGAYVAEEDDQIVIKLHSFASRTDQYLAARLVYEAMSLGAKVYREDPAELTGEDLSADHLDALHREWFSLSCKSMRGKDIQLPIYQFLSLATDSEKWGDEQSLEQALILQLSHLADSYLATDFTISEEGVGEKSVAILQPEMKALILKSLDAAVVNNVEVPLAYLVNALGSSVIDGGGCWVFPAIASIPSSVLQSITSQDFSNAVASKSGEPTEEEWKFIAQGPVIAFLMVAAADGKVDQKEVQSFVTLLQQFALRQELPHIAKMMGLALVNFEEIFERLIPGKVDPVQLMKALIMLIDGSLSAKDAGLLKSAIFYLAKEVASSSGGFLGFGPKISKSEKMALAVLATMLGLVE